MTFFVLDCFTAPELRDLLNRVKEHLRPGAIWLVSEFSIPEKGWRQWHAKAWISMMYLFFRITTGLQARTLPPIGRCLAELSLHRIDIEQRRWGLIVSEVYSLL